MSETIQAKVLETKTDQTFYMAAWVPADANYWLFGIAHTNSEAAMDDFRRQQPTPKETKVVTFTLKNHCVA